MQNVQGRWVSHPRLDSPNVDARLRDIELEFVWLRPDEQEVVLLARPGPKRGVESGLSMCSFGRESDRTPANRRSFGYTHCNSAFSKCDGRASEVLLAPLAVLTLSKVCFVVLDEAQLAAAVNQAGLGARLQEDAADLEVRKERHATEQAAAEQSRRAKSAADAEANRAREYRGQGLISGGARVEVGLTIDRWSETRGEVSFSSSVRFHNTGRAPIIVSALPMDAVRTKDGRLFAVRFRGNEGWRECRPDSGKVIINPGQICDYSGRSSIPASLVPDEFAATGSAAIEAVRVNGSEVLLASAVSK
jgi:hypothetical protein